MPCVTSKASYGAGIQPLAARLPPPSSTFADNPARDTRLRNAASARDVCAFRCTNRRTYSGWRRHCVMGATMWRHMMAIALRRHFGTLEAPAAARARASSPPSSTAGGARHSKARLAGRDSTSAVENGAGLDRRALVATTRHKNATTPTTRDGFPRTRTAMAATSTAPLATPVLVVLKTRAL